MKVALAEGLGEFFGDGTGKTGSEPKGMDLVVSGTVPPGSGLSVSGREGACAEVVELGGVCRRGHNHLPHRQ